MIIACNLNYPDSAIIMLTNPLRRWKQDEKEKKVKEGWIDAPEKKKDEIVKA